MRRGPMLALAMVATAALALALFAVKVSTTVTQVDAVTGSTMYDWYGPFHWHRGPSVWREPLAAWMESQGMAWQPQWQFIGELKCNAYGGVLVRGCSSAPASYQLHGAVGEAVVQQLTGDELGNLVKVMTSGDEAARKVAVERAVNDAVDRYGQPPTRPAANSRG